MNEQANYITIATECIGDLSKENTADKQRQLWRRLIATGQKGLKSVGDKDIDRLLKEAGFE